MTRSSPFYRPLTNENIRQIDQIGRRILEQIGIRIQGSTYLDILKAAGAKVDYENKRVRFDGDWIDEVLKRAPSRFTLYSRDGQNDLHLGKGNVYFGNGGRVFRILDMGTGGYRLTKLRDVADTATLVNHLDHIRFYIIACQAHDIKPVNYHLLDFAYAFNHTTKHVMGGCTDLHGAEQMWKLASIIAGSEDKLRERPFVTVITNTMSPLIIDDNTLDILKFFTTRGLPLCCTPAPIAGATAPATLAGTLAQAHAEALAAVAITQVFAPGARVLYSAIPTAMDLRTMELTMGSVEMGMMCACAVQLAKLYKLPVFTSGGVTEAKRPDIQAGFEKGVSNVAVVLTGADCIRLMAGMLDSGNSISYEQFIIDNEIIGMIHRIQQGITVDEETLGFDVIQKVGPGGNYVLEDHTVNHMMDEFFYPNLSVRCNFDIWEERGRPDMLSRAHHLVKNILDEGKEGLLDLDVISEIKRAFPRSRRI